MAADTVVCRAPGKLFVAGEYAVVEPGNPAILLAVDRYVTVTARPLDPAAEAEAGADVDVVLSSDLAAAPVRLRWQDGRLADLGTPAPGGGPTYVKAAVETVARLLAERRLPAPRLHLSITSTLHEDGRKYGLGSSGAVTAATIKAVAGFCGLSLSAGDRYRLALLATATIDAKSSGGDLAASTYGGWIAYQAPDRDKALALAARAGLERALTEPWPGLAVRRLPPPHALSLQVGWTGQPASTTSLVAHLHRRTWRGTASHQHFLDTSRDLVHAATDALETGDGPGLLKQIRRARHALARLDDEVHLGIFTDKLTALCDTAEAAGGAAKPSGAGGGDCGIALLDATASQDISHVTQRWAAAGVLPLPLRPALEGIEE
ncbi:phosphomevalonate kinase [Streptomyces broussonetiae]|uniref:phosphomevalonate kinase n=1 Tax=Streptomyces broussonetiae TaxID=2686304 RepID=A0ABV5EJD3_9ACTN